MNNVKYFNINSSDEYKKFIHTNPLGGFEKIAISKNHLGKDIIEIQSAPTFYSERLIDELLKSNVTGLDVKYKGSIELDFI